MKANLSVLFVCLGNICRSPMAEAVFRSLVEKEGLADRIDVSSCGLGDWHIGAPPHEGTRAILTQHDISYDGLQAKMMTLEEICTFDYIVAMDRENVAELVRRGVPNDRINLLSDFIPGKEGIDVPDPYFHDNFDEVYELVKAGTQGLLTHIAAHEDLKA